MSELHLPWLELALFLLLGGALGVGRMRERVDARKWSVVISALALLCTLGAWGDFVLSRGTESSDPYSLITPVLGQHFMVIDDLNAPLLPLGAFLYFLTFCATLRTKIRRFSFAWSLAAEAIMLATLCCKEPWGLIALLAAGTVQPYLELRARRRPTGVFAWHMLLFVTLLVVGWGMVQMEGNHGVHTWMAMVPLMLAIFIRCGIAPFHCWTTDLFEHATFGTALLYLAPMTGAYAAVRLVLPNAPEWILRTIGVMSLITAIYAAGMALIQREARRFFCYLFLSHAALVLVGMDTIANLSPSGEPPLGLTGALCVWLSVGLALAGFGLTIRALEARHGRMSLANFHGLYEHTPSLAVCFMLTGLASVGFPGTFGFLGMELLVDGAVEEYAYVGVAVVAVAALNGIAVLRAYFLLFTGTRHVASVPLMVGWRERFTVLTLAALILGGGLYPQPGVASRHHAAREIVEQRQKRFPITPVAPSNLAAEPEAWLTAP